MPYTSYEFYQRDFFGEMIPEESFFKYEYKARTELDNFTFGRLKKLESHNEEIQACVCEMSEYLYTEDQRPKDNGISSESTDGYSVTYQKAKSQGNISRDLYQIATKHLAFSGYLYRGVY